MSQSWQSRLITLNNDAGLQIIEELEQMLEVLKTDGEAFLREQGEKIAEYLEQLARGEITLEQLGRQMEDVKAVIESFGGEMSVKAKVEVQQRIKTILEILFDFLTNLLAKLIQTEAAKDKKGVDASQPG